MERRFERVVDLVYVASDLQAEQAENPMSEIIN